MFKSILGSRDSTSIISQGCEVASKGVILWVQGDLGLQVVALKHGFMYLCLILFFQGCGRDILSWKVGWTRTLNVSLSIYLIVFLLIQYNSQSWFNVVGYRSQWLSRRIPRTLLEKQESKRMKKKVNGLNQKKIIFSGLEFSNVMGTNHKRVTL